MDAEFIAQIARIFGELTVTGTLGMIWWLERKERLLLRDLFIRDWKRTNDAYHQRRVGQSILKSNGESS